MLNPALQRFIPDSTSPSIHRRRVAVFAEYFPPYIGSDRRLFHLIENLQAWEAQYFITPPLRVITRRCEPALFAYGDTFCNHDSTVLFAGFKGRYLSLPSFIHKLYRAGGLRLQLAYALSIPMLVRKALRSIKRIRPDAIVVGHPSFITGIVGVLCAKYARLPLLLDYPDAWTSLAIETSGHRGKWVPKIMHQIERFVAARADRITCITRLLANAVRADGATAPIVIIPNGADLRNFPEPNAAPRTNGPFRILYSGRLEKWAGTDELTDVIQQVCSQIGGRVHFMFVGDGGGAQELRKNIEGRNLGRFCTFLGFRPYEKMAEILAQCDLAIVPFPDTDTTRVSLPCKVFEYMAMGKPVIASDLPGMREVIADQVIWVKNAAPQELAAKILALERDPAQCARYAAAGAALVRGRFGWQSLSQAFERELDATAPQRVRTLAPSLEPLAPAAFPVES